MSGNILDSRARRIVPGKENKQFPDQLRDTAEIVEQVKDDLNNWIEVIDVRLYRNKKIGIPCNWRWTIKRWVAHGMHEWLIDSGWTRENHRRADSYEHEDHELEARYKKEYSGYTVYVNFHVEFTEDVFRKLQEQNGVYKAKKKREKQETLEEIIERRRE